MQSNFAIYVLTYATLALQNVKDTTLNIVKNVHKHAAAALKNAEGWLAKYLNSFLFSVDTRLAYFAINMDRSTKFILLKPYNLP